MKRSLVDLIGNSGIGGTAQGNRETTITPPEATGNAETPEVELSAVIVARDDEEQVGYTVRRLAAHLGSLGLSSEILVVDERSADNTLVVLNLLRRELPELRVVADAPPRRGYIRGVDLSRGKSVLLVDARSNASFAGLGFSLNQIAAGLDAYAVSERYLVFRRSRCRAAVPSLLHHRDPLELAHRFLGRARALGLSVHAADARPSVLARLRAALSPLAHR